MNNKKLIIDMEKIISDKIFKEIFNEYNLKMEKFKDQLYKDTETSIKEASMKVANDLIKEMLEFKKK